MKEGSERREKRKVKLGLATGAAMLAGMAAGHEHVEAKSGNDIRVQELKRALEKRNASAWFEKNLAILSLPEVVGAQRMEKMVLDGDVPLKLQIRYMENALKSGGLITRQLADDLLSPERLSDIYTLNNKVSVRLTTEYALDPQNPEFRNYFKDVDTLRYATSTFMVQKKGGPESCNRFAVQANNETYLVTAYHCVAGSTVEKEYHHDAGTDTAVKRATQEELQSMNITDVSKLPWVHPNQSHKSVSGRVVTSYSVGKGGKEKVDFSIAMRQPENRHLVFDQKSLAKYHSTGMMDFMMYFKPHEEGLINQQTKRVNAAGSSGGPVFASGLGISGNFTGTMEVRDNCLRVCYATSFFSPPEVLPKAIEAARQKSTGSSASMK